MRDAAEWSGVKCSGDIVLPKIPEVYLSVFISTCVFVCVCVCVCVCVYLVCFCLHPTTLTVFYCCVFVSFASVSSLQQKLTEI